jgi:glycosyltransferase involved in cell wall biosynthesis
VKLALVLNDDFSMWHFRRGLIETLVADGHEVYVITPPGLYVEKLRSLGVKHFPVSMNRFISPGEDLRLIYSLYSTFRQTGVQLVHNMTIKPNVYGAIAAKLAGVPRIVALVSGRGYAFSDKKTLRARALSCGAKALYRLAFRYTDRVWFQNQDDRDFFVNEHLVDAPKSIVIRSGGINLREFAAAKPQHDMTVTVTLVAARMVRSKGVLEFIQACKILHERMPHVRFVLVGPLDPRSPDAIGEDVLRSAPATLSWLGFRSDIAEILGRSDIVALPSYYLEGVPRSLLEGMACGKALITTNTPGCRETVDHAVNGLLVPPRDAPALADAIMTLASDKPLRDRFGQRSRQKVESEFDERLVVARVLAELYELPRVSAVDSELAEATRA